MLANNMKIPIGIFFGGATFSRDRSLRTAQQVFEQLNSSSFEPVPIFVDPFGQLILLPDGMPSNSSISEFYPTDKFFAKEERSRFPVYPEQLGALGDTEKIAMASELGDMVSYEALGEHISIAFLALPDPIGLQYHLSQQRIPYTGEYDEGINLFLNRLDLQKLLQKKGYDVPPVLPLSTTEWEKNSLQAIWEDETVSVNYPLLLRPYRKHSAGRSAVVTSKDGPEGLRRAIDQAFGQLRLTAEDWLHMNPVDRESFVRRLAEWRSGIGFPLELHTGSETIVFQRPQSLLDYLATNANERPEAVYIFKSTRAGKSIMVSSLPEGTAFSCLLIPKTEEAGEWETANLRFLGPSRMIVAGTEHFPAVNNGPIPKVSESLTDQLRESCKSLAHDLGFKTGFRLYGILSPGGTLIPEEVQAITGPVPGENLSGAALKSYIVASLKTRQQEVPTEPVYRTLLETLTSDNSQLAASAADTYDTAAGAAAPPPPVAPRQQTIYERELEKLNKEKEAMPESISFPRESKSQEPEPQKKGGIWEQIKAFVSSRVFLRNLGAAVLFLFLMFLLLNIGLRVYTKHGDSMQLEDYQGLLLEDAERKAKAKGLKMEVISRSFQPGKRANEIFAQYPEPLSNVKENRTVFVSVYRSKGDPVVLPSLTDVGDDVDNYRRELGKRKIRLLVQDQKFDPKLEEGTILYLVINGEKVTNTQLRQGKVEVPEGEAVEVVVSTRISSTVDMPDLICKTFAVAQFEIRANTLVLGKVYGGSDGNRDDYYVWKTEPSFTSSKVLPKGTQINLYLTPAKPDDCE